jgi:hypothetical protein
METTPLNANAYLKFKGTDSVGTASDKYASIKVTQIY